MKILGIGVDIVENIRIHKSIKNISFIKRVFSSSEILLAKKIINKKFKKIQKFRNKTRLKKKKKKIKWDGSCRVIRAETRFTALVAIEQEILPNEE